MWSFDWNNIGRMNAVSAAGVLVVVTKAVFIVTSNVVARVTG